MKVLVTGHHGFIGSVLVRALRAAGHDVVGLDTFYFAGCDFGSDEFAVSAIRKDLREVVHDQAFNVGRSDENFRVSEVAEMVEEMVPGCRVTYTEGGGPDPRCYRVSCDKLPRRVPAYRPKWTVRAGIEQLCRGYVACGLTLADFHRRYVRIERIRELIAASRLDGELRWMNAGGVES